MSQVSRWGKEGKKQQMAESLKVQNRFPCIFSFQERGKACWMYLPVGGEHLQCYPRKGTMLSSCRDHFSCQGNIRVSSWEQDHPASFKGGSSFGPWREGGISLRPSVTSPARRMLWGQPRPRPPDGKMGQPSRRKEQTQAEWMNLRTDFSYKAITYSTDLKAWNKLCGATRLRSCMIMDCVWTRFMTLIQYLRHIPVSYCSYLLKQTIRPRFLKRILEEAGTDTAQCQINLCWLPKFSELCSFLWKAARANTDNPHWFKQSGFLAGVNTCGRLQGIYTLLCCLAVLVPFQPADWQNFRSSVRVTS